MENTEFVLPAAPRGLSFDKNDFIKSNFSVDDFLKDHGDVALESMRDDLGAYLKVLRLSMIDLINRDYVNFVNLSATLIGFDKSIGKLQAPLEKLNEDVTQVKQNLEDTMKELSLWLNQRNNLRERKQTLHYYNQTLNHLNTLINTVELIDINKPKVSTFQADRAVSEYNKLRYTLSKCKNIVKTETQTQCADIGEKLHDKLNDMFFFFFNQKNYDGLVSTLQTLSDFNKIIETEELVRRKIVASHLQEIISESHLHRSSEGLNGIYNKILSLLDNELKLILNVSKDEKIVELPDTFNFIINSYWKEVESRIEVHLSSIFAPGNPTIFYSRYIDSMNFIKILESYVSEEDIGSLRRTAEFQSFHKRWNLPVYFQIRFQDIAGAFEAVLNESPREHSNANGFKLSATTACWEAINKCWSDGVFIQAITYKFWKLTLQLLSRYVSWVKQNCIMKSHNNVHSTSLNRENIKITINMYIDVNKLIEITPDIFEMASKKVNLLEAKPLLKQSLDLEIDRLRNCHEPIKDCIVQELLQYFIPQLKQVSDIPRLYRKTNRKVPSSPCGYIENVCSHIQEFRNEYYHIIGEDFYKNLTGDLFEKLTSCYYTSIEEVITSVQRTEESLRRLKQIRHGNQSSVELSGGISDSDKIQIQLNIDVNKYCSLMKKVGFDLTSINAAQMLIQLVENSVKCIDIK